MVESYYLPDLVDVLECEHLRGWCAHDGLNAGTSGCDDCGACYPFNDCGLTEEETRNALARLAAGAELVLVDDPRNGPSVRVGSAA